MRILICVVLVVRMLAGSFSVVMADMIQSAYNDARRDAIHDTSFNWIFAGVCCNIYGIAAAAIVNTAPPAHLLLGKSPEYINIYTQTYKHERRNRQMTLAAFGSGGCCIGYLAVMFRFADAAPIASPIP